MKKGGLADSPFFHIPPQSAAPPVAPRRISKTPKRLNKTKLPTQVKKDNQINKSNHDTMTPRHHDAMLDTTTPRYHDTVIEAIRKALKEFGKEAATHRFTLEEKKAIADIIYTYKGQGIKTSENELARIAINFIISDYHENGENSVLHKALNALNT